MIILAVWLTQEPYEEGHQPPEKAVPVKKNKRIRKYSSEELLQFKPKDK